MSKNLLFIFTLIITSFTSCSNLKKNSNQSPPKKNSVATASMRENSLQLPPVRPFPIADVHLHTRNYIQKGITLKQTYSILASKNVKRAAVFGIPLQQRWDMETGISPSYYLHDDQSLYYYSAIDALIASEYLALDNEKKKMFDPMIVGFNPTDGRATDHIKNMLLSFPGVFSGIGEFSIKKEVVSSKIAGGAANIEDPALGKILDFAAQTGLVVILHCDVDAMISHNKEKPTFLKALDKLFKKHSKTKIIWAHSGLGRYVKAREKHTLWLNSLLKRHSNLFIDISWDVVAKQFFKGNALSNQWKSILTKYSNRILFGSDVVSPTSQKYENILKLYDKIWRELPDTAVKNITYRNYKKLFNEARAKVRSWERKNL